MLQKTMPPDVRFERSLGDQRVLVALNTSHQPRRLDVAGTADLMLSTTLDRDGEVIRGATVLRADEGVILALDA